MIANPMTLNFGYTFNNANGDNTSVMLTGPITLLNQGRTLTNSMSSSATLTLGDPECAIHIDFASHRGDSGYVTHH